MNYSEIFKNTKDDLTNLINEMVDNLEYYGVDNFKRQALEYSKGMKGSNIGDGMVVFLSHLESRVRNTMEYFHIKDNS